MAFKDFRTRAEPAAKPEAPRTPIDGTPDSTFLDEGCELSGRLSFRESVRIDGRVEGEIECKKTVVVGEAGRIQAQLSSDSVVVYGEVDGDIHARRKITLHKSARVSGDMSTAGIVIEEGARVEGRILIGAEEAAPPVTPDKKPIPLQSKG